MRHRAVRGGWICALFLLFVLTGSSQTSSEDRIRALMEEIQVLTRLVNLQQERLEAVEARVHPASELPQKSQHQPPHASEPPPPTKQLQAAAPNAATEAGPTVEDRASPPAAWVSEPAAHV